MLTFFLAEWLHNGSWWSHTSSLTHFTQERDGHILPRWLSSHGNGEVMHMPDLSNSEQVLVILTWLTHSPHAYMLLYLHTNGSHLRIIINISTPPPQGLLGLFKGCIHYVILTPQLYRGNWECLRGVSTRLFWHSLWALLCWIGWWRQETRPSGKVSMFLIC